MSVWGQVKSVLSRHGECQLKGASQGARVMERDPDQARSHHDEYYDLLTRVLVRVFPRIRDNINLTRLILI